MENLPDSVQVGPFTYSIDSFDVKRVPDLGDAYVDFGAMAIRVGGPLPLQRQAAGLLQCVCQIIFRMGGRNNEEDYEEALRFAPMFTSTFAATPEVFSWAMASLLDGRADREPHRALSKEIEEALSEKVRRATPDGGFLSKVFADQYIGPDSSYEPSKPVDTPELRKAKALAVLQMTEDEAIRESLAGHVDGVFVLTTSGMTRYRENEAKAEAEFNERMEQAEDLTNRLRKAGVSMDQVKELSTLFEDQHSLQARLAVVNAEIEKKRRIADTVKEEAEDILDDGWKNWQDRDDGFGGNP